MKSEYRKAVKDESLRQKFLDKFFIKNKIKTIPGIVYDDDYTKSFGFFDKQVEKGRMRKRDIKSLKESLKSKDELHALAFFARGAMGRGSNNPVFVRPEMFLFSYEDFVSIVADHEYIHVKNAQQGIKLKEGFEISYLNSDHFNDDIILKIDESIAYCNQLSKAIEKKNFSSMIKDSLEILEDINLKFKRKRKFESIGEETAVKIQTERNDLIIDKFSGVKFRKNSK
jgi:hypothetical protein